MSFGFGRLRLSPRDFWSMTPRELAHAMAPAGGAVAAPGRGELDRLMRLFPDRQPDQQKETG